MIDEIIIKTRGEGDKDFTWFAPCPVDESWTEKYKVFNSIYSENNLFADIENGNYRIFFSKILAPWTITRPSGAITPVHTILMASGKCGSESAKAFYKIITNIFLGNKENVVTLFAEKLPKDFIETMFADKAERTADGKKRVSERLESIVVELSDIEIPESHILKDNTFVFDKYEGNVDAFFSELKKITVPSDREEYISFVITDRKFNEKFDFSCFTSGIGLSKSSDEIVRIAKTIKELPPKVPPQPKEESKAEEKVTKQNPIVGGTAPGNNANNDTNQIAYCISKIRSNPSYRKLLIVASIIILGLLVAVKSCVNRSGSNSEKCSPESKEQQYSPTSPDSLKKSKDTLIIKVKTDTCKTPTDTLTMKKDSLQK